MAKLALGGVLIVAFVVLATTVSGVLEATPFWSRVVTIALCIAFLALARFLRLFSKDRS